MTSCDCNCGVVVPMDCNGLRVDIPTDISKVQMAVALNGRLRVGSEEDVDDLPPGAWLLVTNNPPVTWETLLAEADKARTGAENDLVGMAVLSAVNATNWRRDADGTRWMTDTLDDFRAKLIAFCAAAVEAGYVADGRIIVTWPQVQHWILTGELVTPLDAESMTWPWTPAREEGRTWRTEVMERLEELEALFSSFGALVMAEVEGAEP